jgi:hypothetical protein
LIKAKAIYNIDEKLKFPIYERLKQEWILINVWEKMDRLFIETKPYIEVQIFWWTSNKLKWALTKEEFIDKYFSK